jgi:ABC-type transport system involved in cytochrome bd biosynthesis fused ATPase/permease subunit
LSYAIEKARLTGWLKGLPAGLNTWVGEHGLRMSGGERQRLALTRTLLKDAPIMLLDEPTAHLDAVLEGKILGELLSACEGKGLILITHRLIGMERMDEILVIDRGEVIERGKHADLVKGQGLYASMFATQYRGMLE